MLIDGDQGELEEFLVRVDSDGSGSIEWTEFLDFMASQLRGATTEDKCCCLQAAGSNIPPQGSRVEEGV